MPSSKFNRLPTPRLRPAICFPPPGSCRKELWDEHPWWILGWYRWKDWHPPVPVDLHGQITMEWQPDSLTYYGRHVRPGTIISIELYHYNFPQMYVVTLRLHIDPDHDLIHTFYDTERASYPPIETGLLTMINQVGIDYRQAWARG